MKDKGLFFLIISFSCVSLVFDQYFGNKYIEQFVGNILPSARKTETEKTVGGIAGIGGMTTEDLENFNKGGSKYEDETYGGMTAEDLENFNKGGSKYGNN